MFRIITLCLFVLPGTVHAQKFVSVESIDTVPLIDETTATAAGADPSVEVSPSATKSGFDGEVVTIDAATFGNSLVFSGATLEEIRSLLINAAPNATAADAENLIVGRAVTDENGDTFITLDVAGGDGPNTAAGGDAGSAFAEQELGECNAGTDWVSDALHCHNDYPIE